MLRSSHPGLFGCATSDVDTRKSGLFVGCSYLCITNITALRTKVRELSAEWKDGKNGFGGTIGRLRHAGGKKQDDTLHRVCLVMASHGFSPNMSSDMLRE